MRTLLLAPVGLYGVLAYSAARRTREIGLRVAPGAQPARVSGRVVLRGLALAAAGAVSGAVLVAWGSRLLEGVLFEVEAFDPAVLGAVGATILAVALVAAWVPARRASRIAPLRVARRRADELVDLLFRQTCERGWSRGAFQQAQCRGETDRVARADRERAARRALGTGSRIRVPPARTSLLRGTVQRRRGCAAA